MSNNVDINRRKILLGAAALAATSTFGMLGAPSVVRAQEPVRLGFMTALTGLQTILGETQLNCFLMAVDEINAAGGIDGRPIEHVIEDNQTSTRGTIDKSRQLVFRDQVDVIIGMIASLEHVAARSVTTPAQKLLMYTTYYEGGVCEKYFASTGQLPNQQIEPFVPWLTENIGKSVYIVGSDYIWPRDSAKLIQSAFEAQGGEVLGSEFLPFGTQDFGSTFDRIRRAKPDIVWFMVAGADSVTFLTQYRSFEMEPQLVGTGLDDIFSRAHPDLVEGALSNQAYFMSVDTDENRDFLKRYQERFGSDAPVNAIGEAAYCATHLYALAVAKAGTTDAEAVIKALNQVQFDAPQGRVSISGSNNHMLTNSLVGRCNAEGEWEILKNFGQIQPDVPGCSL